MVKNLKLNGSMKIYKTTGIASSAPSVSSQATSSSEEETGDIMIIFTKGGL